MKRNHFEAVQSGMFEAVDGAIRNNTSSPTADFFWSVKEGVREAVENIFADGDVRAALIELLAAREAFEKFADARLDVEARRDD